MGTVTQRIKKIKVECRLEDFVEADGRIKLNELQQFPPKKFNDIAEDLNQLVEQGIVENRGDDFYFVPNAMKYFDRTLEADATKMLIFRSFVELRLLQINTFSLCILPDEGLHHEEFDRNKTDVKLADMVADGSLKKISLESGSMIDSGSDGEYRIANKAQMPQRLREKYEKLEQVLLPCEELATRLVMELKRPYEKKIAIINSPSFIGEMTDEIAKKISRVSQIYTEAQEFFNRLPEPMGRYFAEDFEAASENEINLNQITQYLEDLKRVYEKKIEAITQHEEEERLVHEQAVHDSFKYKLTHLFSKKA